MSTTKEKNDNYLRPFRLFLAAVATVSGVVGAFAAGSGVVDTAAARPLPARVVVADFTTPYLPASDWPWPKRITTPSVAPMSDWPWGPLAR